MALAAIACWLCKNYEMILSLSLSRAALSWSAITDATAYWRRNWGRSGSWMIPLVHILYSVYNSKPILAKYFAPWWVPIQDISKQFFFLDNSSKLFLIKVGLFSTDWPRPRAEEPLPIGPVICALCALTPGLNLYLLKLKWVKRRQKLMCPYETLQIIKKKIRRGTLKVKAARLVIHDPSLSLCVLFRPLATLAPEDSYFFFFPESWVSQHALLSFSPRM